MENKQPQDDFDTFLRSVKDVDRDENSSPVTTRLMVTLSKIGETDVVKLMAVMGVSWSEFTESVNSLRGAGLIDVEEENQPAIIRLTEEGTQWALTITSSSRPDRDH